MTIDEERQRLALEKVRAKKAYYDHQAPREGATDEELAQFEVDEHNLNMAATRARLAFEAAMKEPNTDPLGGAPFYVVVVEFPKLPGNRAVYEVPITDSPSAIRKEVKAIKELGCEIVAVYRLDAFSPRRDVTKEVQNVE